MEDKKMLKRSACNAKLPRERQMLFILRSFTRIQNALAASRKRVRELEDGELAWQNGMLKTRIEKMQRKYDNLKAAYNSLLSVNNRRKAIVKSVWDMIPDDIRQKFERDSTDAFERRLEEIDNEKVV